MVPWLLALSVSAAGLAISSERHLPKGSATPSQKALMLLDVHNDIRDLTKLIEDEIGRFESAEASAAAYTEIHDLQQTLLEKKKISLEEYEESLLRRDSALAQVKVHRIKLEELRTRREVKELLKQTAKATDPKDAATLDSFYAAYLRLWKAECARMKHEIEAGQASLRLAHFRHNLVLDLQHSKGAAAYYELVERRKEVEVEQAKLRALLRFDKVCGEGIPQLSEVKNLLPY
jgi:hypothetical protein